MQMLSSDAVRIGVSVHKGMQPAEAEVAQLQALVAKLQAERDALQWAASHDDLTGLPNRRLFTAMAPSFLDGRSAVVFVLDLNGFKPVNDRFGHDAGDSVLCLVGQRLAVWAGGNPVARLGGDEFAGILTNPRADQQWWSPAIATLAAAIAAPMLVGGQIITVAASIGVTPAHGRVPINDLLHQADLAMYQAKRHMRATDRSGSAWAGPAAGENADLQRSERRALRHHGSPHEAIITAYPNSETTTAAAAPAGPYLTSSNGLEAPQMAPSGTTQHTPAKPIPPECEPDERDPDSVAPASSYRSGDPVWIHRNGTWRPGEIQMASERAVLARYCYAEGIGTTVDTVWAQYVAARHSSPAATTQIRLSDVDFA